MSIRDGLSETAQVGKRTRELLIHPSTCPSFNVHHVRLAGISYAVDGFHFTRLNPQLSQLMACTHGKGEVLMGDKWVPCGENTAYLTPPRRIHSYRALKKGPWNLCWVIFREDGNRIPAIPSQEPMLVQLDPRPLHDAILGLYRESIGARDLGIMHHWTEIIVAQAKRLLQPFHHNPRLWKLWEEIDANLSREWTIDQMASAVHVSSEHLRRLCHQTIGRSPMDHVAHLRMIKAATLLTSTGEKVENIARQVGYQNAFAFSSAFKRIYGVTPSSFRIKQP